MPVEAGIKKSHVVVHRSVAVWLRSAILYVENSEAYLIEKQNEQYFYDTSNNW